jgi:hypothetical protein
VALASLASLTAQKNGITIFSDATTWSEYTQYRAGFEQEWAAKLWGNRYVYYAGLMAKHLGASLGPEFLVSKGGSHPWHQLGGGWAHLGWAVVALFYLALGREIWRGGRAIRQWWRARRQGQFSSGWQQVFWPAALVVISLLPAVITVDAPHATRSLQCFYLLAVLAWRVLIEGQKWWQKRLAAGRWRDNFVVKNIFMIVFLLVFGVQNILYYVDYWQKFSLAQGRYLAGFDQVIARGVQTGSPYLVVSGDNEYRYILAAWYARLRPEEFERTLERAAATSYGIKKGLRVGQFRFEVTPESRLVTEGVIIYNSEEELWQISEPLSE